LMEMTWKDVLKWLMVSTLLFAPVLAYIDVALSDYANGTTVEDAWKLRRDIDDLVAINKYGMPEKALALTGRFWLVIAAAGFLIGLLMSKPPAGYMTRQENLACLLWFSLGVFFAMYGIEGLTPILISILRGSFLQDEFSHAVIDVIEISNAYGIICLYTTARLLFGGESLLGFLKFFGLFSAPAWFTFSPRFNGENGWRSLRGGDASN